MKRKIKLLCLLLWIPFCGQGTVIKRIDIFFLDSYMDAAWKITCHDFKNSLAHMIDSLSIYDKSTINKFVKAFNDLIPEKDLPLHPDTRIKIVLYGEDKTFEVCIGLIVLKNWYPYILSDNLKDLICEVTKKQAGWRPCQS